MPASAGSGRSPSASAFGILSAASMVGMVLVGWLTDRMNRPLLLGTIYLLRGLTFILLVYVGADYGALVGFSVLFGLVDYSTVPVTASLVASHIGLRVMGLAFGLISAGHQIGGALGAYMGGYLFDLYAQYAWVWWSSLALAVLAGLMCYLVRERAARRRRPGCVIADRERRRASIRLSPEMRRGGPAGTAPFVKPVGRMAPRSAGAISCPRR